MGEKTDRSKDIRLSEAQMRMPGQDDVAESSKEDGTASTSEASGLAEEYRYVVADLKRIGGIALVMLGALVALALLLP